MHRPMVLSATLIALLIAASATLAPAADEVDAALDGHAKQVERARAAFELAVKRATEQTVPRLIRAAEAAEKRKDDVAAARAYTEALRLDRENASARGYFEKKNALDQVLMKLTKEWSPVIVISEPEEEKQVYYESMLGVYNQGKDRVVTLSVPDGSSIFPEDLVRRAATVAGQPPSTKLDAYEATGMVAVPRDGEYEFSGAMADVRLDDKPVGELRTNTPLRLPLKKGWYRIAVSADKYHHGLCGITIVDVKNKAKVPVFNSLADIKKFLNPATEGDARMDLSRWSPQRAKALNLKPADSE